MSDKELPATNGRLQIDSNTLRDSDDPSSSMGDEQATLSLTENQFGNGPSHGMHVKNEGPNQEPWLNCH